MLAIVLTAGVGHPLPGQPAARPRVPALPPDSIGRAVAAAIYAPGNIVWVDSIATGPYPRDLIWLWFRDDAPQAERQRAVDAVEGEVVGGARIRPGGMYYVRIRHDGTTGPLHAAIARLRRMPFVRLATPDLSIVHRLPPS